MAEDSPAAWRDLVAWCQGLPNIQGYMSGAWTPEYDVGDGMMWVGSAQTLAAYGLSPEETCSALREKIAAYLGSDSPPLWWRLLPQLSELWSLGDGYADSDNWLEREIVLRRPLYLTSTRLVTYDDVTPAKRALVKREGHSAPDWANFRCRVLAECEPSFVRERDPYVVRDPTPHRQWYASLPPGTKLVEPAAEWDEAEESALAKVRFLNGEPLDEMTEFTRIDGRLGAVLDGSRRVA
jgi:hypothetical protein